MMRRHWISPPYASPAWWSPIPWAAPFPGQLFAVGGPIGGHGFWLREAFTIGRSPRSDLWLGNQLVSRHHAVIYTAEGYWFIQDQGSVTGTFVNGRPVHWKALSDGDRIRIGMTEFEFWQG